LDINIYILKNRLTLLSSSDPVFVLYTEGGGEGGWGFNIMLKKHVSNISYHSWDRKWTLFYFIANFPSVFYLTRLRIPENCRTFFQFSLYCSSSPSTSCQLRCRKMSGLSCSFVLYKVQHLKDTLLILLQDLANPYPSVLSTEYFFCRNVYRKVLILPFLNSDVTNNALKFLCNRCLYQITMVSCYQIRITLSSLRY
jgi:hypothetical protein